MHGCLSRLGALSLLVLAAPPLAAQLPRLEDPPKLYVPAQPPSAAERQRRESLKQYVLGLLCEREDRLLEALKAYEEAARLDPTAPAVFQAQIPLLVALDRGRDALAACKTSLKLDPDSHAAWHLASRLHKGLGQFAEAQQALERGLKTASIKEHPDLAQQMWLDLGAMHELADETEPAIRALTEAAKILEHPDVLLDHGPFDRDMILARCADTYERIGNLYRKTKHYHEAIQAFNRAEQRTPKQGTAASSSTLPNFARSRGSPPTPSTISTLICAGNHSASSLMR